MDIEDGEVLKIVVIYDVPGEDTFINNLWYKASFATTQAGATVLSGVGTGMGTIYDTVKAFLNTGVTVDTAMLYVMEWDTDHWAVAAYVGEVSVSKTGTDSGAFNAAQVAPYVYLTTARPKTRGRKFLAGTSVVAITDGKLTSGAQTAMGNWGTAMLGDITISSGNTLKPGVASTVTGTFWDFQTATADDVPGTQRRRRIGVGG